MTQWTDSYFHLPFRTSYQPNDVAPPASEKVTAKPINENNRYWLYMKFEREVPKVLRVIMQSCNHAGITDNLFCQQFFFITHQFPF